MGDVFQLMSPHLGQVAHSFAGVDAGDGTLPQPSNTRRGTFLSL